MSGNPLRNEKLVGRREITQKDNFAKDNTFLWDIDKKRKINLLIINKFRMIIMSIFVKIFNNIL